MNPRSQTTLAVLCLLTAVICPPVRAGGSWLVDGRTVQALDVKTSNADPNAFYTDGSRPMTSKLVFDSSVSSLFRAYVPWDGMYDFFIMDPTNEAVHLCNGTSGFYPTEDLDIFGNILGDTHGSGSVDIGETTLKGGTWMVDAVGPYDQCIVSKGYADNRYVQKAAVTSPLVFDASLSSETTGLFKASVPWDAQYDFFAFDPQYEAIKLSPTIAELGFEAGNLVMYGYGTIRYVGENTYISFEERMLAGGGWFVSKVENDPTAILNRSYADDHYIRSAVSNQTVSVYCYSDDPQQSPKSITFRAVAPDVGDVSAIVDPEDGFIVSDQWGQAARISSSSMRLGTVDTEIEILGSDVYLYADATAPDHALNRRTGDNRYVMKSTGITTNYTVRAGDVLQVQNGVITAINP